MKGEEKQKKQKVNAPNVNELPPGLLSCANNVKISNAAACL